MNLKSFSMAICQNGDCSRYQHQSEPQLNTTASCVNPLDLFCNSDGYISVSQKCDDIYSQQKQNKTFNSSKNGDIHTVFQSKNSDFSLKKIGCLYKSQLVSSLSFTNKLLLSIITKLCNSKFAIDNGGYINLTNSQIAEHSNDHFSLRQVRRNLATLQDEGFIKIDYFGCKRWISLPDDTRCRSFVQIYDFEGLDFTASEIVITSYLMDKASFYIKAGLKELSLSDLDSKVVPSYLNTSLKTVKGTFTKLKSLSLISYYNQDDKCRVLRAFKFTDDITKLYLMSSNIKESSKCKDVVRKKAVNKVISTVTEHEKNDFNNFYFELGHKQHRINFFSKEARQVWNSFLVKTNLRRVDYRYLQAPLSLTEKQIHSVLFSRSFAYRSFPQLNFFPQEAMEKNGLIHKPKPKLF